MRNSTPSATRILTVVSLVVLCTLSFAVVYGTQNIVDTPSQDSLFSFPKPDVPHHRRAIHHLRAQSTNALSPTPTSTPSPTPNTDSQSPPVQSTKSSSPTPVSSPTSLTTSSTSSDSSTSSSESTSTSQSSDTTTSTTSSTSTSSSTTSSTPSSSSTTPSLSSDTGCVRRLLRCRTIANDTAAQPPRRLQPYLTCHLVDRRRVSLQTHLCQPIPSSLPAVRTSTISASSTAGAASKGFFANKAAVGITFSIVGIICGLAAVMGIISVIRRYRRARYRHDDFYEKYPRVGGSADRSNFSREPAELGQGPLGDSATDLTTGPAPADAYPDRAIHYGQPDPSTVFRPVDYGIDYPPNAAYADPAPAAYENYDYDPNRPSSAASHPFADPANAPRAAPGAPPVTYPRSFQGRAQEVVTADSYYGSNSAGVGAAGVGFAQ
ncbi:hypothetical protein EDB85DRAFT_2001298 [Lactarius pseudohatsudake]|nr:hypothetical protein EDB85DRAFT_2001298 [Lactarius pseudohatsudake]